MSSTKVKLAGHYKMIARKPDGTERVVADWFPNLILDAGLNRMGSGAIVTHCRVGTGNSTPLVSQSSLDAQVASSNTYVATSSGVAVDYSYSYQRVTFRFGAGAAEGNLAEVGVGWGNGPVGALFSRALIVDEEGDPTVITILDDEVLDVIYELRYIPPGDNVFSVTISGVEYDCILRPAALGDGAANVFAGVAWAGTSSYGYSGNIGTVTQIPSGSSAGSSFTLKEAYSNNSLEQRFLFYMGLDNNPPGGVRSVLWNMSLGSYQCQFDPVIAKDNTKTLSLTFLITWDRA